METKYRKIKSLKFLYEVNEDGVVRNIKSKHILASKDVHGYREIPFCINGNFVYKYVHRLVAECWLPPKPGEDYEIDHIDRNRANNNYKNLRWVTHLENLSFRDKDAMHECMINAQKISRQMAERKILLFNDSGFSKEFGSIKEAAEYVSSVTGKTNLHTIRNGLQRCCAKQYRTSNGYKAKYINNL